jgi:large subunit ribosomal protein L25
MKEVILTAENRVIVGKQVQVLRRAGKLPAVIYGVGRSPIPITLNLHDTTLRLQGITSSQLVTVDLNGTQHVGLIREKQRNPITGALIHLDFQEVSMTELLRTSVLIELTGDAPAVKTFDGVVVTRLEELDVEALPRDLPSRITVDISNLTEIGSSIRVHDLVIPSGVEILSDPEDIVVVITAPVREEEFVEEPVGAEEPEVIDRGKKEEDF